MASRDKKTTNVGRKQSTTASPIIQTKEETESINTKTDKPIEEKRQPSLRKKEQLAAKALKRPIILKAKPKQKIVVTKALLGKGKRNVKKSLLKNVKRKRPLSLRERINKKEQVVAEAIDEKITKKKIKKEPVDSDEAPATAVKTNKRMKKGKDIESTTTPTTVPLIDEVVIKEEPEDETMPIVASATPIAEDAKVEKRLPRNARKQKLVEKSTSEGDIAKKRTKKDSVEIALSKVDVSDSNVIDNLDLNVSKITNKDKKTALTLTRRHSIEKFPLTYQDVKVHDDSAFTNLPKTLKSKRVVRPRPSSESKSRSSPYTTRSDSPMRMLRNGKTRRLQQFPLFDGLDSEYKMRRRLASDFSGSEISKLSGYESDSSLSSSIHENIHETDKEKELQLKKEILETLENNPPDTAEEKQIAETFSAAIKRSLSMDATATGTTSESEQKTIDTNSNVCQNAAKSEPTTPLKTDFVSDMPKLLGIMKQAFNDKGVTITEENPEITGRRKTRSSVKKAQTPEKDSPTQQLPATTISTLNAVGIALGSEITVTAEEVVKPEPEEEESVPLVDAPVEEPQAEEVEQPQSEEEVGPAVSAAESEPMEEHPADTVEDAEAELIDILSRNKNKTTPESTPSTSVNGGSPHNEDKSTGNGSVDESAESMAEKSQILKALGLQTLQEAEETRKKQVPKGENYTGTLKTVIKLNRCGEKKKSGRNPIKMTLQKKGRSSTGRDDDDKMDEDEYKIMKEGTSWKHQSAVGGGQSSDTAGAQRKSHYSNRSNMDGSSEHTSDGDTNNQEEGGSGKMLVIPEKASSFSIHPERLCKDECSYCFGKFGLFDTPCHIAQMKTVERQDKILSNEKHLTRDSCLCDACYRHVDRKANMSQYASNKSVKRNALVAPAPRQNHCYVLGCNHIASNILRRKWLIKMRKAVCQVINIDLDNPGLHSIPTCKEHYAAVEHLMVCAMCKRRLARNHIHYLGSESNDLQTVLNRMSIPVKLNEKPVVCKLCRYFASLVLKNSEHLPEDARNFFVEYKKRLLHFHNVEPMDDADAIEPILAPMKQESKHDNTKKRKRLTKQQNNDPPVLEPEVDIMSVGGGGNEEANDVVPSSESRPDSPSEYMVDYRNLIPNIAIECLNDVDITNRLDKKSSLSIRRISKAEAQEKKRMRSDIAVQRLGSNPSISIRQMFPGEEDVPLNGGIEFNNVKERTPEGWEKCTSTIQYDPDMKLLWQELQKPYGNQSSFLRHLILLEKYFRNGDLVLSPRASSLSVNYTESVQNRLRAYDNISSTAGQVQPLSMLPFNNPKLPFNTTIEKPCDKTLDKIDKTQTSITPVAMSTPNASNVIVNQAQLPKNVPLTITQANSIASVNTLPAPVAILSAAAPTPTIAVNVNPPITSPSPITSTPTPQTATVTTAKSKPPGLISLQQASKLPPNTVTKPQSQKIKFPITKNWRPKLIPIDPTSKPEKKPGLVQVISGGKPYHITLEDYKKMCAIKRTYDLRQKRLQETLKNQTNPNSLLKTTKRSGSSKSPSTSDQEDNYSSSEAPPSKAIETKPIVDAIKLPATTAAAVAGILSTPSLDKMPLNLPKIPKSLTVIPQTVTINKVANISRPNSPKAKS